MSRLFVLLLLISALTIPHIHAEQSTRVLLFVRDGSRDLELMLSREVGVMKEMLEKAGFEVDVATLSGEPISAGSTEVKPELKLSDVDISGYDGLIVPCMAPSADTPVPTGAVAIIKKASEAGKAIAAQRGSVYLLAEAGVLSGKKYAFASEVDVNEQPEFKGGIYSGTGVVKDGNVMTSGVCPLAADGLGLPDGTEELTRALIDTLGGKN